MKQSLFALALLGLLAWGLWRAPSPPPGIEHHEIFALGTLIQVSIADPAPPGLIARVTQALQDFEQQWSVNTTGELASLNLALAAQPAAPLPQRLREGFSQARRACRTSGGRFDPGIGALVALWGFDDESRFRDAPPQPDQIDALLHQGRSLCEATLNDQIRLPGPGAQFNFGASAKGRAVELIIALLRSEGIDNAIVNAGGDLKALGRRQDRPWRIGIRHPRPEQAGKEVLASLSLADGEALFSSGDYERYFEFEGRRYHHILDPRSGAPAMRSQSATVLHHDAEWADAAVTALFVAGPSDAQQVMQAMGIEHYLLVDADGRLHISPAMQERLDPGA